MRKLSQRAEAIDRKLTNNFPFFASQAPLLIRTKDGQVKPLILNQAQKIIDAKVNLQRREKGFVRALIVKSRQQGASTYIGARLFHKNVRFKGMSSFVMAHDAATSTKLFRMAEFFNDNIHPTLRPHIERSNAKELYFDRMMSNYFVGTAGSGSVGRGGTIQNFHGSEVAFWKRPDDIKTGVMQSVPNIKNTEVFLESTANGYDAMFWPMVQAALRGEGEYQVIFTPWFIQDEYRDDATGLVATDEEKELKRVFGLDDEQLAFRRNKIAFFNGSTALFMQEYPSSVHEAFQVSGDTLFGGILLEQARKRQVYDFDSPIIMGVDVATEVDRLCYTIRRGRQVLYLQSHSCKEKGSKTTTQIAGEVIHLAKRFGVSHCFIDLGEAGKGVYDNLKDLDTPFVIKGVRFNEKPSDEHQYKNKRAEMYGLAYDWMQDGSLPQDMDDETDQLVADLRVIPQFKLNANEQKQLPPKEEIKKDYGFSPDMSDSFVLTFAYPVKNLRIAGASRGQVTVNRRGFRSR